MLWTRSAQTTGKFKIRKNKNNDNVNNSSNKDNNDDKNRNNSSNEKNHNIKNDSNNKANNNIYHNRIVVESRLRLDEASGCRVLGLSFQIEEHSKVGNSVEVLNFSKGVNRAKLIRGEMEKSRNYKTLHLNRAIFWSDIKFG